MKQIQHYCPTLGATLVAEEDIDSGIALFRGIPYASVSERWTQSRVQHSLPSTFDAIKFGPKCPQPPHISLIQVALPAPVVEVDEFKCLNLNITTPLASLPEKEQNESTSLLPVMVWVHGGRFLVGSNSDPRNNPQVLSRLASAGGHPIVLVQINYRLGILGFAASSDMASEYELMTSKGSNLPQTPDDFGNFGIVDQRNAFEWIQTHIRDFGGDPSNVTAFGNSAGSASLHMHILSGRPPFDRAILMSGCAPTIGPLPLILFETTWTKLCKAAKISAETYQERLEKLRSLPQEEIVQTVQKCAPMANFTPLADGKYLPKAWRLGDPHPDSRCKDIIIGNVGVEGILFDAVSDLIPQKLFHQKILAAFKSGSDAELFCKYFGFALSEEQSPEVFRDAMRSFLSAVMFHFPNIRMAESLEKAYLYQFEEPSPFGGKTDGLPVHGQCAVFLFNSEREVWPEPAQKVSLEMAKLWTAFSYGKQPWLPYSDAQKFMRFGPSGKCSMKSFDDDETRDYGYLKWMRDHFDETMRLIMSLA